MVTVVRNVDVEVVVAVVTGAVVDLNEGISVKHVVIQFIDVKIVYYEHIIFEINKHYLPLLTY